MLFFGVVVVPDTQTSCEFLLSPCFPFCSARVVNGATMGFPPPQVPSEAFRHIFMHGFLFPTHKSDTSPGLRRIRQNWVPSFATCGWCPHPCQDLYPQVLLVFGWFIQVSDCGFTAPFCTEAELHLFLQSVSAYVHDP